MHLDYADQLALAMQEGATTAEMAALLDALNGQWRDFFDAVGPELAQGWAEHASQASLEIVDSSIRGFAEGITLPAPKFTDAFKDKMGAAVEGNVGLISSMQGDYADAMQGVVMRAFTDPDGGAHKIFEEALKHYPEDAKFNVRKRAALTARLETAKVTALVESERCADLGIEEFMWNHSGGSADPRPDHVQMDGKIFRYDDLPVIDRRTGQRGLPGTIWNCKCFATPVFPFTERVDQGRAKEILKETVETKEFDFEKMTVRKYTRKIDKEIFAQRETKDVPKGMESLRANVLKDFR